MYWRTMTVVVSSVMGQAAGMVLLGPGGLLAGLGVLAVVVHTLESVYLGGRRSVRFGLVFGAVMFAILGLMYLSPREVAVTTIVEPLASTPVEVIEPLPMEYTDAAPNMERSNEMQQWVLARREIGPIGRHALYVLEMTDALDMTVDTFYSGLLHGETDLGLRLLLRRESLLLEVREGLRHLRAR